MATFIIRFSDGKEIPLDKATSLQVAQAVSITKVDDAPTKNP